MTAGYQQDNRLVTAISRTGSCVLCGVQTYRYKPGEESNDFVNEVI